MASAGFTLRPASLDDAGIVAALTRQDQAETGSPQTATVEDTRHDWMSPGFDVHRCVLIAEADGTMVGHSWIWPQHGTVHAGGFTIPDARGRGIGSAMLRWAIETARELHPGGIFYAGANSVRPEAEVMLKEREMRFERIFLRMIHAAPGAIPEPVWPAGIGLRALEGEALVDAVVEAHDASFIDHWEFKPADRAEWLHMLSSEDPALWFVAFAGEQIAGFNRCQLSVHDGGIRGVLGPIGTTRAYRHIGLGRALLRHGLRAMVAKGATDVQLGVDSINPTGAVRLYESEGFERTSEFRLYALDL